MQSHTFRLSSVSLASLLWPQPATCWHRQSSRQPSQPEPAANTVPRTQLATTPLATTRTTQAAEASDVKPVTWPVRPEATVSATLTEEPVLLTTLLTPPVSEPQSRPTSQELSQRTQQPPWSTRPPLLVSVRRSRHNSSPVSNNDQVH